MSLWDKAKEIVNSEEVQNGLNKVKENTKEILSEENINLCVNRAKETAKAIENSESYQKVKSEVKKVTETQEFKDGMNDLKDLGSKGLSLTSKGLDKLSQKLNDSKK